LPPAHLIAKPPTTNRTTIMKLTIQAVAMTSCICASSAFILPISRGANSLTKVTKNTALFGKLDDLTSDITPRDDDKFANPEKDSHDYNKLDKEDIDRYGPGNLGNFVDFNEFDGGDGQMGVAGDGSKGDLEEIGDDSTQTVVQSSNAQSNALGGVKVKSTSRERSARNAWGTSNGYGDKLREEGVDTARAQQLENWQNQLEVLKVRKKARYETDEFDQTAESNEDEDWRTLKKFGVERNQDFDLEEAFGAVMPGDEVEEEVLSITARVGTIGYSSFPLRNDFMGFADFRAALTTSSLDWSVEPAEGAINKSEDTEFTVRWKPSGPGAEECFLVIETEDFKKTWRVVANTA